MEEENLTKNVLKNSIEEITKGANNLSMDDLDKMKREAWNQLETVNAMMDFKRKLKAIK